jgi:DNA-binding response OmpR family regulator
MPDVTGFELAQMIKARKKNANVPIIFLTAYYNEDQHIIEGYDTGAVDYLNKPVNPAILRSKVAIFAELHRKQRNLEEVNRALLAEVSSRRRAEEQLRELNNTLEQRVAERTASLQLSEARLRDSERQLQDLIAAVPAAIYTTDAEGKITYFNQGAVELTGRTPTNGASRGNCTIPTVGRSRTTSAPWPSPSKRAVPSATPKSWRSVSMGPGFPSFRIRRRFATAPAT